MAERAKPAAAGKTDRPPGPTFIGPPGRLRLVGVDNARLTELQDVLLPGTLRPRRASGALRRSRRPERLRLRLPADTRPGTYTVSLSFADGKQQEATVAVEPQSRLRVTPSALRLAAAPGAATSARLLIENRGNVPIAVTAALVAGLFDDDGIEATMASVYQLDTDDIGKIVSHAFSKLRQAHGGLLKLHVRQGAGELAVGESRLLEIETRLGEKLAAGHGYHGLLEIGGHGIAVEVTVLRNGAGGIK